MSSQPLNPLVGDASAPWRHAPRYDPDADADLFADIAKRLSGLDYLETPVWLFDAERCQFLWTNRAGLDIWQATDLVEAQRRDMASSQSEAVYTLLNDYLDRVRAGETPATWVTLNPRGTLQRYYQSHHLFTLLDGRDCLLIEARPEPPAEALLSLASNHSLTLGLYDLEGRLVSGNPRFAQLSPDNPSLEDLTRLDPKRFDRPGWLSAIRSTREVRGETSLQTERGERPYRWEARLLNVRKGQGQILVSFYDHTDLLVAEAEEARGALLEIALDAIVIIDADGVLIGFNPAAERLFGHQREDVLGRSLAEIIIPPELRERHERGMARHQREGTSDILGARIELPALRADGSRFLAELAIIEFKSRGRTQFIGFVRDVEALRRAEAQVHAERARFSSVFEHTPDPILIFDDEQRVIHANLACSRILGWPADELVGKDEAELLVTAGAGEEDWAGQAPSHVFRDPRGLKIPVELRSTRFDLEGRSHRVALVRDLRPEIRSAREKQRLAEQVKQAQRLKELGTLAGGVAHYFNNLLAAINGNLDILEELPETPDEVHAHLAELGAVSLRGKEMVRRILAFSRKASPGRAPVQLAPVAREAIALVRLAYPPTIELVLQADETLPTIEANSSQIHQVLVNLLTNACQAIGDRTGRVEIQISRVDLPRGDGGLELRAGRYLRVDITDDGPGMDAVTAAQAFNPFFTTKPVDEGTGLGLAEVHGIAAEHGGASAIATRPGAGCRVSVYLPENAASPQRSAPATPAKPAQSGTDTLEGYRILFLDDEPRLGRLFHRLMRIRAAEAVCFTEPTAALAHLEANPRCADLVMTDISMPQMSGLVFARLLSQLNPEVPILFASGRDLNDLSTVQLPNPTATIQKPYRAAELVAVLQRLRVRHGGAAAPVDSDAGP